MKLNNNVQNYLKLFTAGMILLWLFIVSPLNPLYSDYNLGEMNFIKLNFIYWIAVSAFAFWLIFFINRLNFEKYSTSIFIISYGLHLSFYIFYGFDVMDTGFSLSKQWSMYHGLWKENFDAIAGTNLIGGLWLLIPGEPLLIWARLGFVLLQASIAFVSYKILLLYFNKRQIFVVALPLSLFLSIWHLYFTINYDNLPFLFFSMSIYSLLKGLKCETFRKKNFVVGGVLAVLAVFCKITYLAALLFPVFLIILDNSIFERRLTKQRILYFLYGLLIGVFVLAGIVLLIGGLDSYMFYFGDIIKELFTIKDPAKLYTHNHSFIKLYKLYKSEIMFAASNVLKCVFYVLLIEYFRIKSGRLKYIKFTVVFVGAFILFYLIFEIDKMNKYDEKTPGNIFSFILSIYIITAFFTRNMYLKNYLVLIVSSFGLFFFSFLGSDLVFRAAFHIGAALILFAVPVILIKDTELKFFNTTFKFKFLYYFILIVFSLSMFNKKDNLYREPGFKFISKNFESPSLVGIKSNPQRVEVADSLLVYLNSLQDIKNKKIVFTHSNALMYYLTGSNYILRYPWDILNDYYTLSEDLSLARPDLFVVSKISHRIRTWPLLMPSYKDNAETVAKRYYDFYDSFIKENNYVEVYKNSFYTVYGLQDKGVQDEQSTE